MKFNLLFALPALAISSFALTPRALSQGSLTPPPGAPVPVMKTIQDVFDKAATVEAQSTAQTGVLSAIQAKQNGLPNRIPLVGGQPGVAVDGVTGAITISSPGSYFLTGNLNVESAANGITIASADVSLDLNGFSVRRLTGTGGSGVLINGYFTGVDVRNGSSDTGLYGMRVQGAASYCRGTRPGGVAIDAGIAIGCTAGIGTIVSPQKHLGTP